MCVVVWLIWPTRVYVSPPSLTATVQPALDALVGQGFFNDMIAARAPEHRVRSALDALRKHFGTRTVPPPYGDHRNINHIGFITATAVPACRGRTALLSRGIRERRAYIGSRSRRHANVYRVPPRVGASSRVSLPALSDSFQLNLEPMSLKPEPETTQVIPPTAKEVHFEDSHSVSGLVTNISRSISTNQIALIQTENTHCTSTRRTTGAVSL